MRASAVVAAIAVGVVGCFNIGNEDGVCSTGELCQCNGIGNCSYSCPDGGCSFRCEGIGNCDMTCEGGGCDLSCRGTGNCLMDCPDNSCTINCEGQGNCVLNAP